MKMSDYFPQAFEVKHNKSFAVQNCHWVTFGEDFHSNCEQDNAIEHAVLNHDRLTSENARLRDMLKRLTSHDNCRKDVIHLMSEADSLIQELEKGDE